MAPFSFSGRKPVIHCPWIPTARLPEPMKPLRSKIRCSPPSARSPTIRKPGILFRDITTLLGNARAFRRAIDELVHPYAGQKIDKIAGIEARGFILGGAVAHQLSAGFIPIRKKGKLPHETVRVAYSLEYGLDEMEMHKDAVSAGREGDPGRRPDRHRRHGRRRGQAACARWARISLLPASSSTCRISAAARSSRRSTCRCAR